MQRLVFDVFCRVIDNYGDAGIALRLARQLAAEHACRVTLWIDDLDVLHRVLSATGPGEGVRIRDVSSADAGTGAPLPDAVLDVFGCGLPSAYLSAMQRSARPPAWIVLEYLSAEAWVEGIHGLPSPHPRSGLARWFFFPGYTEQTGGLIRERGLLDHRDRYARLHDARSREWTSHGWPMPSPETLLVSLFSYENAALGALLATWRDDIPPVACIVPDGVATGAITECFGSLSVGEHRTIGSLSLGIAPFVDQQAFDHRLWACDVAFVRGEDSFVRAQWAAKPLVWDIYAQSAGAHLVKLDAFLDRYTASCNGDAADSVRAFNRAFASQHGLAAAHAWRTFRDALPSIEAHARRWSAMLAAQSDLATRLMAFVRERL
ncbi:MAG TPA: elongation factor P maturation arginine rhamnosyltransferase EarP [Casimicrobiaceae bacterium]|nr:elongation factor P maturation arginine rhamnosyltransferase EarP [Casimicrobiaceae bacterium]